MTDVGLPCNGRMVIGVDEVDVVWSPAHHKYENHKGEHLNNLKTILLQIDVTKIYNQNHTRFLSFLALVKAACGTKRFAVERSP